MDETPNLGLPYIMAAQSQKHVTHNEGIRALDAILQLSVLDRGLTAPPGSPADGARYIVASGATGAWSGHVGEIAAWQDGAWMFYAPVEGWIAWVADEDIAVVWNGSAWTALTTGGGGGSGRELLTANRTYYVRTDGSNSNNGLANTSGGAFATLQKAYDVISATLDLGGNTVTIQVGSGTYTSGLAVSQPWTGGGAVLLQGDTSTPANVIISTTSAACINTTVPLPGALTVQGFELRTTSGGNGIDHSGGGVIIAGVMRYGACSNAHMQVASGCYIGVVSNYTISGNASQHWNALHGGFIQCDGKTITLSGTPAFSSPFAVATNTGKIEAIGNTFSGSATGTRYSAASNGVINTNGAGASAFPGNAAGSTATGGQYL